MQVDPNNSVRKTIAALCEEVVRGHPEYISPCVGAIRAFLKAGPYTKSFVQLNSSLTLISVRYEVR